MPRNAAVSVHEAVAVIVQFRSYFQSNELPIWSSEVWQKMSTALGGKWSRDCVYTNVTKNRRQILDLAWKNMNIKVLRKQDLNNNSYFDETVVSNAVSSSDGEEADDMRKDDPGMQTFDLVLTEEEWGEIKPHLNSSSENHDIRLKPWCWTNVVADAMWLQFRMPCAFVFKRADVTLSADGLTQTMSINGKCKSKRCANTFNGDATKNISNTNGLTISVQTRDTRGKDHDVVKRPLNGRRRAKARREIKAEGCSVWKKRQARKFRKPGDVEPPIIPYDNVIRQACQEGVNAELGVKKSDGRDLIRTIEDIALEPEFCGIIHSVPSRPFHAFYYLPTQLHAYKEYCRLNRDSCFICIDATGSVVKALERSDGTKSGHIFVYSIVINFDGTTIAVNQMLSEQHDTEFLEFWIKRWIRAGAPKPKEAICDYSRALLSALCLAFNNQTVKAYVGSRFISIAKSDISHYPATLLSVDVAHLIHLVCRWKCFKSLRHSSIKELFVRCVALMVDCISFSDFEDILSLICAVGMQTHEDAELDIPQASTTKEARRKLEEMIATWGIQVDFDVKNPTIELEKDRPESFVLNDLNEPHCTGETSIKNSIDRKVARAMVIRTTGQDLNPFFLPEFVKNVSRLCCEFPLWTRVGRYNSKGRATSSYVESYFNYLKTQVFRNTKRPIRVDKFIKVHARDIAGATLLGSSKLLQSHVQSCSNPSHEPQSSEEVSGDIIQLANSEIPDLDLLSSENWREKAGVLHVVNLKKTPINWNVDSDLIAVAKWPTEETDPDEASSVQIVQNSSDLNLNTNLLSSTPLGDKSLDNELMLWVAADHSYAKLEDITEVDNIMDDGAFVNLFPPHGISPLEQQRESSKQTTNCNFTANTNADKAQQEDMPTDNLNAYIEDALKVCAMAASSELESEKLHTNVNLIKPLKTSKYFRAYPEVRHMNEHLLKNRRAVLLPNGLCCREVKVNGESFFVHKTCSFDSFAQIILTAAIDNDKYFDFIQSSTNNIFQLIVQLIQKSITQRTHLDRMLILKPFCPSTVKMSTENRIISYLIDAELSIANLVEKVMKSESSINNVQECPYCGRRTYPSTLMVPNHKTIGRLGFNGLQIALNFHSPIYNIRCRNPCPGRYTLYRELNNHVFIELDVRPNLQATSGVECKLRQMPITLRLGETEEITYEYRLVGVVAYTPGHYVAYCLRKNGSWELHNDMRKDIETCKLDTVINPHLVVYIRTGNQSASG